MTKISPELVSAAFGGLALLVAALSTYTANRSRRIGEDQRLRKEQIRQLRKRDEAAVGYIYRLRRDLLENGLAVPVLPKILEDEDDDASLLPSPRRPDGPPPDPGAISGG